MTDPKSNPDMLTQLNKDRLFSFDKPQDLRIDNSGSG